MQNGKTMTSIFQLAVDECKKIPPQEAAVNSGGFLDKEKNVLTISYLGIPYHIQYPEINFLDAQLLKEREKILILHYLAQSGKHVKEKGFIGFTDIPSGKMYYSHITLRLYKPLIIKFGNSPEEFIQKSKQFNGHISDVSEFSIKFSVFPKISVVFIIYPEDEEFPADAKIIFNSEAEIFDIENIVAMCAELVIKLCSS